MFWNAIEKVKGYAFLWIIVCLGFLFFSSSCVFAQTNPYVGKWGYTVLGHGGSWYTWKTEAGTFTFNNDWTPTTPGTVTSTYMESANFCPDANHCKSSDTQSHTYTVNADGTATLDGVMKFVISDNGEVIIADGTSFPEGQALIVAVKMDPTHTYTLADVTGDYYMGGYEYNALGGSKGFYRVHSQISTMNNGTAVINGTINGDGAIIPVLNKEGSCSINTSGLMLLNGTMTGYAGNGSVSVFSNPNLQGGTNNDFASYIALKRADRQYSTADLQGTWVMAGFGDYQKTLFRSEFGTITCDVAGNCSVSLKRKNSDGTNTNFSKTLSMILAADGSYNGFYFTSAMPHLSGAMGSNGNAMIMIMNTESQTTDNRSFGIAVKCSTCTPSTPVPGTLKWSYDTGGNINSSPAIGTDGTIYVGSDDNRFYALNPDGTLKWSYNAGTGIGFGSSPAIGTDGTIYVGSNGNKLYAFNPDGTLKWSYNTGVYIYSSPAIGTDGTIYVGSGDGFFYALNPEGTLKWSYRAGGKIDSSPAIGADGTIYVGSDDGKLYAFNPGGTLRWSYATRSYIDSSPAIGADRTIYLGSTDGKLYAINPDGTLKWSYELNTTTEFISSSAAIGADGTIYVGSQAGRLYAVNPDGTLKWSWSDATGYWINSSPAIGDDGTIYAGSRDNNLHAFNPDGTLKWSYATGENIYSSPAIGADGTIYVGSLDSKLHAIYSSSLGLANSPWPQFGHDPKNTRRVPYTDTLPPTITGATSTTADGYYMAGSAINITFNFSEAVTSATGLTINLNSGGSITTGPLSNATIWSGTYTITAGQSSPDLNITSVTGTLTDGALNSMSNPTLPAGYNIGDTKAIIVGAFPFVTLLSNDSALGTPGYLATDGTKLYITAVVGGNQKIISLPIGGGTTTNLYDAFNPMKLTILGDSIYWIDPNSGPNTDTQIFKAPNAGGGTKTTIYSGSPVGEPICDGSGIVAGGDGKLYTADEVQGRVNVLNPDGSGLTQIGPSRYDGWFDTEHYNFITESAGVLYIADYGKSGVNFPQVVSIPVSGGSFTTLHSGAPFNLISDITVGSGMLYIADSGANTIWEMPVSGGTPTVLVSGPPFISLAGLVYYKNALYVADGVNKAIYKVILTHDGDMNYDKVVDLADAILVTKLLAGLNLSGVNAGADINSDGKIGASEMLYILQKMAGMR